MRSCLTRSPLAAALLLAAAPYLPCIAAAQQPPGTPVQVGAAGKREATPGVARIAPDGAPTMEARASATSAMAFRVAQPPVLDGRTDDAVWARAQVIDHFLEYEPNEGAETRFRTEARVGYDDHNFYVLVRMFDPAPDSIVSLLARRDVRVTSEQLNLVIDSYHDRRTAYQFAVNPAGVKRDFYVYNDGVEDPSWDAVWDVATAVDSLGWVAEFRIPFSQLRFADKAEHTFGLMIVRDVARTGARISWPLYRRNQQGYVSQAGEVGGILGVPSPRRLEVTPYVVTKNATRPDAGGFERRQAVTGGADVKYGLSSNLTLDATINPDFGQVEADPAVLNLSTFETFLDERRPFFLEGTGIFSFRTDCGDVDTDCTGLFYSRRIGRSPQLLDVFGDERSATATTILGAAKVTGRLNGGLSVGLLDAVTQRENGPDDRTIEPRANYLVARAVQDLGGGRTSIGAMLTAVSRELDDRSDDYLRGEAFAAGLDFRHRFLADRYELSATVAGSRVGGSEQAIALLQRCTEFSCAHSYQRPDDAVQYDAGRRSLSGDAERVTISKFGGGATRFQSVYQRYSPGFEINDAGFMARADDQLFRNWFSVQLNTPAHFYNRAFFNFNYWQNWTAAGLPTNVGVNQNSHIQFRNQVWGHFGVNGAGFIPTYDDREARGGPAVRQSVRGEAWAGIEGDQRKPVTPNVFGGAFTSDAGRSGGWWLEPGVQLRASSRFSASLGVRFRRSVNDNQWRRNFGDIGADTTHYTFARLEQTTTSLTSRINFTATPTLSLQFYAQPFVSTGDYDDWRELADPRARRYEDRYRPYATASDPGGFNFKQFQSNTVVRWEYRPGSTLFFVWSQGRDGFVPDAARFDLGRDYSDLFTLHPNNTFLVKASYWFNP
ncbi:MAG: DUF5916 domain-containing protein [Gemmatimonadaceae bacterium]